MAIPFIDLKRFVRPAIDEVLADWREHLENTAFVGGARVAELELAMSAYLDAPPMIACGNGTDALTIALQAAGIGPGARVALPDLTFWATFEAPVQLGARPVLIDIGDDLHLDLDELAAAHATERIDAVVLPQLFGWCAARTAEIRELCAREGITLLEDSAQAFGVQREGRSIYDAPISTISFYPAKVLGGASDGGGIFVADPELAAHTRALCNHGRTAHYAFGAIGWNSRMSGPNAAFLLRMLARADAMLKSRRDALARYAALIAELADPRVRLHLPPRGVTGNGYLAVLTVDGLDGDTLAATIRSAGVGCARTYPEPLSVQPPARGRYDAVSDLPRSRAFCRSVVNLPLFAGIEPAEIETSVSVFADAIKR